MVVKYGCRSSLNSTGLVIRGSIHHPVVKTVKSKNRFARRGREEAACQVNNVRDTGGGAVSPSSTVTGVTLDSGTNGNP
ncbi:colicin release lysis protein [Klebsiella pneumoniae]|nr:MULTISPECIES: colicin release lysis protein [Klebsiella]HBV2584344.1 colicin release lysis protein [Klebsiella pneumoniae]HDU3884169.1 colicin release lysis protein [Klebsiella pneumoniae subsp. pneumoniae]HBV2589668.1 colicin release lysis protein [Klebsiella pneumoniae]HBV2600112.1 colicin release lysis protein [Klebsiella pneumoniae]HBV2621128.1 colicin release lysis protein [Klebsiella pneumoniae]